MKKGYYAEDGKRKFRLHIPPRFNAAATLAFRTLASNFVTNPKAVRTYDLINAIMEPTIDVRGALKRHTSEQHTVFSALQTLRAYRDQTLETKIGMASGVMLVVDGVNQLANNGPIASGKKFIASINGHNTSQTFVPSAKPAESVASSTEKADTAPVKEKRREIQVRLANEDLLAAIPSTPHLERVEGPSDTKDAVARRGIVNAEIARDKNFGPLFAAIASTPPLTTDFKHTIHDAMLARQTEDKKAAVHANWNSRAPSLQTNHTEEPVQFPDVEAYAGLHPRFPHMTRFCQLDTVNESRHGKLPEKIPSFILAPG